MARKPTSLRWGGRLSGSAYTGGWGDAPWDSRTWNQFETNAGKRVTLLAWGQPFGELNLGPLNQTKARGAVSLVTTDFPIGEILLGAANARLDAIAARAKEFGGEILLRPGWELNGDWYAWGRKPEYAAAWRYMVNRIRGAGATNVKFVWCINILGGTSVADPAPYYPGDGYVDYIGIDGYNWGNGPNHVGSWQSPGQVFQPTIERCAQIAPTKKIILCEVGCSEYGGDKPAWIKQFLGNFLPTHSRIVGFAWFNDPRSSDGMDWFIESSPATTAAFKAGIAASSYRAPA